MTCGTISAIIWSQIYRERYKTKSNKKKNNNPAKFTFPTQHRKHRHRQTKPYSPFRLSHQKMIHVVSKGYHTHRGYARRRVRFHQSSAESLRVWENRMKNPGTEDVCVWYVKTQRRMPGTYYLVRRLATPVCVWWVEQKDNNDVYKRLCSCTAFLSDPYIFMMQPRLK